MPRAHTYTYEWHYRTDTCVHAALHEQREIHTQAQASIPFHSAIPFEPRASRLNSHRRGARISRHRTPRRACFMPPFVCDACTHVFMYARMRVCRRPTADVLQSAGTNCQHSRLGMPFPFGNHLGSRTGYDRDTAHARPRIIRNYRKLIPDWEGPGKDPGPSGSEG